MTTLMMKVIKSKRACNYHGMPMRMYQKKSKINYLRTMNAVTLMAYKFLLSDFDEYMMFKRFCTV